MIFLKLILLAAGASFFLAVSAAALASFLVLTGAPKPCVDRSLQPAPAADAGLQANWTDVAARTRNGEAVPLSLTEGQASELAEAHLRENDVPVSDFRVFFCPDGSAEALGKVDLAGLESEVLVEGRLDIEGEQPLLRIDSIEAGNLPAFLAGEIVDLLVDEGEVRRLPLTRSILALEIRDGEAVVVVGP